MERRKFIKTTVVGTGGLLINPYFFGCCGKSKVSAASEGNCSGANVLADRGQRYLFLDDHWIDGQSGVTRSFHKAVKEKNNPLLAKEGLFNQGYGPYVFRWGRKQSPYTAWISGGDGEQTSVDGLNWTSLGKSSDLQTVFDGNVSGYNILYHGSSLFNDYPYLCATGFRYTPDYNKFHYRFARSRNGMQWEAIPGGGIWDGPSDVISFYWDKNKKKFVAYYKVWRYKGVTLDGEPFVAYGHLDTNIEDDGKVFHITGETYLPKKVIDVKLQYGGGINDDGGGAPTDKKMQMIRVIGYADSSDFLHWENEQIIIEPSDDAPLGDQSYGMQVNFLDNMYIGLFNHFNGATGLMQTLLAWSYDGVHFTVHDKQFFIASGEKGAWDYGMIVYPTEFMDAGNGQQYTYYGSIGVDHLESDASLYNGALGRAWIRRDGFASLKGGWIETVPIKVQSKRMGFNMTGTIKVSLKSTSGKVIVKKAVLSGDHHCLIPDIDLSAWIDKDVIVHLDISKGELFSIML